MEKLTRERRSYSPGPLGLGSLELDVMLFIWKREENGENSTTVKDAFRVFYAHNDLTYTTVRTVFHRLEKKGTFNGWLRHIKQKGRSTITQHDQEKKLASKCLTGLSLSFLMVISRAR